MTRRRQGRPSYSLTRRFVQQYRLVVRRNEGFRHRQAAQTRPQASAKIRKEQTLDTAYLLRRAAAGYRHVLAVDDGVTAHTFDALFGRAERLANAMDTLGV